MDRMITVRSAVFTALLVASVTTMLNSCGGSGPATETDKIVLKAGHPANADEPYHMGLVEMARIAREKSNGRIEIQIYPAMQLGSEKAMIEGLLLGTIDIVVTANGSATNFVPQLGILDLPFLFRDRAHMYRVMDGEVGRELERAMEERGFHLLGFYEAGVRHIMTSEIPIHSIEDLQGLKMRFFGLGARVMQRLGVDTQLLAGGDIYPALERGTIDATEFSMPAIDLDLGFYQIAKHYYFPGWHQQSTTFELMVNMEKWNAMSDQQKAARSTAGSSSSSRSMPA